MRSKNEELDLGETQKNMQFCTVFALKSVYAVILHLLRLIVRGKKDCFANHSRSHAPIFVQI